MHLLYNSDSYAVVQFDLPTPGDPGPATANGLAVTGFEIVDKFARREVFLQGALAERFRAGVKSLAAGDPSQDQFDEFIAGFAAAAPQPLALH
jgi:hypothetical protein